MLGRSLSRSKVKDEESADTQGSSARRRTQSSLNRNRPGVQITGASRESKNKTTNVTVSEPLLEEEDEEDWTKHHYSDWAKHRYSPNPSKSSSSAKSRGSDLTGISEVLPRRPGTESDYGDFRSDGGSTSSTKAQESDDDQEDSAPIALLQSSQPAQVGTIKGRYVIRVVRASLKQAFGIRFDVSVVSGNAASLVASVDLPHLGIRKGDHLLSVNGFELASINEVRQLIETSLSIVLVMQQRGVNCQVSPPKYKTAIAALEPMDRLLLSASKVRITDLKRGEFKLSLRRSSHKQKFGLALEAALSKSKNQELAILMSEDMPHLALERNDRMHMINGIPPSTRKECAHILNTAMKINLTFRRDPSRIKNLVHVTHPVNDSEDDHGDGLPSNETSCCPLFGWCGGPNGNGPRQWTISS